MTDWWAAFSLAHPYLAVLSLLGTVVALAAGIALLPENKEKQ